MDVVKQKAGLGDLWQNCGSEWLDRSTKSLLPSEIEEAATLYHLAFPLTLIIKISILTSLLAPK